MSFDAMDHETPTADLESLWSLAFDTAVRMKTLFPERPTVALEVGTWAGRTALVLAEACDLVFTVDHGFGNANDRLGPIARGLGQAHIFHTFARNVGDRFCTTIFPCRGPSRTWAAAWKRPLDVVFIDGSHEHLDCVADIQDWRRHLRPGGRLIVHDYGVFEGVTKAVDELMPGHKRAGVTLAYEDIP